MALRMKWDINGKGTPAATGDGMGYHGPDLPKGSWPAKVKRMEVVKIASAGENKGKPRIRVLLEVTGLTGDKAKYNGHPIWDGLNIIPSSVPFVNGFLHGLTDGSESAKRAIEAAFWDEDKGPVFRRITNKKTKEKETHIIKIGRVTINSPNGETMVQVTTRPDEYKGNYKAEVTGYIPLDAKVVAGFGKSDDDDDDDDIDDDDMLEDADEDDEDDDDIDDDDDDEDEDEDDEDEDDDDEDSDDEDDDDISDEQDAKETAKAGSRKRPPF